MQRIGKIGLVILVVGLMSLTLVLSLTACGSEKSVGNSNLEPEKDEIIRKVKWLLDKADPETIKMAHKILDRIDLKNLGRTKMILANPICVSYPEDGVVARGQYLEAWFEPAAYWDLIQIKALKTPTPYEPWGPLDSRGPVYNMTQGTLTLSYTDTNGKPVEMERIIEIDNRTRKISYKESTATTLKLKDIFEPLPSPLGEGIVTLLMDFSHWVTIYMGRD